MGVEPPVSRLFQWILHPQDNHPFRDVGPLFPEYIHTRGGQLVPLHSLSRVSPLGRDPVCSNKGLENSFRPSFLLDHSHAGFRTGSIRSRTGGRPVYLFPLHRADAFCGMDGLPPGEKPGLSAPNSIFSWHPCPGRAQLFDHNTEQILERPVPSLGYCPEKRSRLCAGVDQSLLCVFTERKAERGGSVLFPGTGTGAERLQGSSQQRDRCPAQRAIGERLPRYCFGRDHRSG